MAFLLPLLLLAQTCPARLVNVTIDDGDGDPSTGLKPQHTDGWYTLRGSEHLVNEWNVDTTHIYGHSLSTTVLMGIDTANLTLTFNGTNIWAYYAIDTKFGTDMLFYLDDDQTPAGSVHEAKRSDTGDVHGPVDNYDSDDTWWRYNQLLFASKTLTQATHTLTMVITSNAQFFDYAIYSTDDGEVDAADPLPGTSSSAGSPSTASRTPLKRHGVEKLAEIVVPVVGGGALVAAFCFWSLVRRRRRHAQDHTTAWQEPEGMDDPAADASALASADARTEKAITPYAAQPQLQEKPETAVPKQRLMDAVLGPKESDDAGGRIAPLPVPDLEASAGPNNGRPRMEGGPKRRAILEMMLGLDPLRPARHTDQTWGESTAEIRAELERLRAEAEEARAENEMLRQAVEPPPYSDGGRSESGSVLVRGGRL